MDHMMNNTTSRRDFITKLAMTAAGVSLSAKAFPLQGNIIGANEKIRVGFIGVGNRGSQLMGLFMGNPDCEVAALCDVYEPFMSRKPDDISPRYVKELGARLPKMGEQFAQKPTLYKDWQKLLEDKSIDAVVIATPDHWHALQTISAIQAGKDVYVEKPLTITLSEGRKMVEAQAASKQVVAVGLNRRGNVFYQKLAQEIPAGKIGKVTVARAARIDAMFPDGIGKMRPENPPSNLDWDAWLGPRAYRPYQYNIAPYKFRWWSDYSSQMGNWGVHYMDAIRWLMGEKAPIAITACGGKYALTHDGDIPDTMQVIYEFASGAMITFSIFESSSAGFLQSHEVELRGTKATLFAGESGYRIVPNRPGQFQTWKEMMEAEEEKQTNEMLSDGSSGDSSKILVRNFLDCIKSRQTPLCTLEEGHRSTTFAHLANIALATKERLQWDPEKERFTNHTKANELLHYNYRSRWKMLGL
ncbi:MAG: Gfo/Idh/MocA family oxidoreductase [Tannerella sp.]|jgi:predicted dehydrogenase|nr:Gfo/Idh/MocA family oxidoreductase [Tannerella sp.]